MADAVRNQETGLLVNPEDVDAVADAVATLLLDAPRAQKMGEAGRARVEKELNWACFTRGVLEAAGVPARGAGP